MFEVGDKIIDSRGLEGVVTGVDMKSKLPYRVAFNVGEDGELQDCSGHDFVKIGRDERIAAAWRRYEGKEA